MSEYPKNLPQFFPQPYPSAPCDSFNCLSRAAYFIGKPEGPHNICHRLCPTCAESVVRSIPEELKRAFIPVEGTVLVTEEFLAQAEAAIKEVAGIELLKDQLVAVGREQDLLLNHIAELEGQLAKLKEAGKVEGQEKPADSGNRKGR